jgi:TolA-binding protein
VEIMRSIVLGLLMMATAAGCAAARNTPAQELAWERWGACNRFSTITLERIDLDGRLVVNGYQVDGARFSSCVREAAADHVRRGAAPVPQAVVLVKIYGCLGGAM